MKNIFKAPEKLELQKTFPTVFLAGSIEMGKAVDWQTEITNRLDNVNIINPRRDDWDSSWIQDISNPQFREQVEWEYDGIRKSDLVVFFFDPKTKSPITLLELGVVLQSGTRAVVYCPEGYWRKGNVDIYCHLHGIVVFNDKELFYKEVERTTRLMYAFKK